ncbi:MULTISPECIES: NfeD family protein [unclassified Pseudomonas]|uniref:NfeD family protein n=1 Tax=unclassified Pseudomonas TaxID=196821 RepID=UPI000C889934|nr:MULTISPECIES: NfeD family protein [unclassified Pseudomonas]PNA03875.1 serine protease [Pseudomonas sp. FW305-BF15]PNB78550.1 serine protease [Pseudomonas sp. FW305-BF6]
MNIRCCALALLLLSGSVIAADGPFTAVSPVGLWLITLGITFLIAEAALPNYGLIGLGGIVMFVIGALILSNAELPVPMMIGLGLVSALLLIALLIRALKTRPRQPVSGDAGLLGSVTAVTVVQLEDSRNGWVQLQGERWQVLSATPLHTGQPVRVVGRKGLLLQVAATDAAPLGE